MEKQPGKVTKSFFPDTYEEPGQKRLLGIVRACKRDPWSKGHNFRAINNPSSKENIVDFRNFYQKMGFSQDRQEQYSLKN